MNSIQNDEIDLFNVFKTIWTGKWIIIAFVVLSNLIGFGYMQVAVPKYNVSALYTFNDSIKNYQKLKMDERMISYLGRDWIKQKSKSNRSSLSLVKKFEVSLLTTIPLTVSGYEALFERANKGLTQEIYTNAKVAVDFLQKLELNDGELWLSPIVSKRYLNASFIIMIIDSGQTAINFDSVSIVKTSPDTVIVIILSMVLGVFTGLIFISVRNILRKNQNIF